MKGVFWGGGHNSCGFHCHLHICPCFSFPWFHSRCLLQNSHIFCSYTFLWNSSSWWANHVCHPLFPPCSFHFCFRRQKFRVFFLKTICSWSCYIYTGSPPTSREAHDPSTNPLELTFLSIQAVVLNLINGEIKVGDPWARSLPFFKLITVVGLFRLCLLHVSSSCPASCYLPCRENIQ